MVYLLLIIASIFYTCHLDKSFACQPSSLDQRSRTTPREPDHRPITVVANPSTTEAETSNVEATTEILDTEHITNTAAAHKNITVVDENDNEEITNPLTDEEQNNETISSVKTTLQIIIHTTTTEETATTVPQIVVNSTATSTNITESLDEEE